MKFAFWMNGHRFQVLIGLFKLFSYFRNTFSSQITNLWNKKNQSIQESTPNITTSKILKRCLIKYSITITKAATVVAENSRIFISSDELLSDSFFFSITPPFNY